MTPKEILEETLEYHHLDTMVEDGSRLWNAIIDAMEKYHQAKSGLSDNEICPYCDSTNIHIGKGVKIVDFKK